MSKDTKVYRIDYTATLNWEDDFQWMDTEVQPWVLALYKLIWDLSTAGTDAILKQLEAIEDHYREHEDDEYSVEDARSYFPEDSQMLEELAEKLETIQTHAQGMTLLETMQIELLEALTSDIRCNENGQFEVTLDKWIDVTGDALPDDKSEEQ